MRARLVLLCGISEPTQAKRQRESFYYRMWYRKNREKMKAMRSQRRDRLRQEIREYDRAYRELNREKLRTYHRLYYQNSPGRQEYMRQRNSRRNRDIRP